MQSRLRVSLYCILSVLEDVECQRKGVIAVSWWHNVTVDDFILRGKVHKRMICFPMRLGALHCCIPSEYSGSSTQNNNKINPGSSNGVVLSGLSEIIKAMFVLSIGPKLRPHFRMHTGEYLFSSTSSSFFKKFACRSCIIIFRFINIIFEFSFLNNHSLCFLHFNYLTIYCFVLFRFGGGMYVCSPIIWHSFRSNPSQYFDGKTKDETTFEVAAIMST